MPESRHRYSSHPAGCTPNPETLTPNPETLTPKHGNAHPCFGVLCTHALLHTMTDSSSSSSSSFHPDSIERLVSEGYPRTFESEAFDAPPPPPRAAIAERPPSHAARTAVSLGRWLGKQGTITARAGLHCPVTVVDARYDYGRVLLLVRTPGETARDWVQSTSVKWAFRTTTEKQ